MTTCAVQGQIYASDGSAIAVIGRPATMTLRLENPEGGYHGLVGRVFRQVVLGADSAELVVVAGAAYDAEGVEFVMTADQVTSLLPADRPSIDLVHTIEEITDDGAVEVFTRRFSVRRKASGAPAAIITVGGGDCVVVSYAGASAPSPFAEWLAKPGNDGKSYADFLASITGSEALVSLGALSLTGSSLLHTDAQGAAKLSPLGAPALDFLAGPDIPSMRAVIGAAPLHDADLTGAAKAATPDQADVSRRLVTTEWARQNIDTAVALKADKARAVTGAGLATGGGDLTADRVITVPEASEAEAVAGAASDKVMTPRRTKAAIDAAAGAAASKTLTVTGAGLASGGGDLTADRVITVTEASDAEALAGAAADKAMTPRRTKAAVDAAVEPKADKARAVTGAGLATGGGDLTADRVITVTEASDAEALAGEAADKVMTPRRTKAAIDAAAALKADKARAVTGGGLATGGGYLTADRVITVTEASDAEALAGEAADTVMTPRRTKAAVDAAVDLKADKARAVTGGGLASGGGDLSADRVITVTEASDAEALAGAAADKVMTPRRTKAAVDAAAALKADKTLTVTGGGLATGGGDLTADRVITVTEASEAEVLAGAAADKVMTPRRTKIAVDAVQTALIGGAPVGLRTFGEISAALNGDANFAATTAAALAGKISAARSITAGGLITGGGDLSADRTLTVSEASEAEALAGAIGDKAMTPRRTKAAVDAAVSELQGAVQAVSNSLGGDVNFVATMQAALAEKVSTSRAVMGAGLVAGGGSLTADRTLTVTEASEFEALAGTAADKAMTPRRTKAVVDAAVVTLQESLDELAASQSGGVIAAESWAVLAAYPTGARAAGDQARVTGADAGTHTDPVAGGTVANRGIYRWSVSPAGWRRVADLEADDAAASAATAAGHAASALAAVAPTAMLPACVSNFYPCDEGAGTALRDVIGGAHASTTTGAGTIAWTSIGSLKLTNAWFKLPSIAHRSIIAVFRAPDGMNTGYYLCNKDGLAIGPSYGNSQTSIPTFKMLSGWGIHPLTRRIDAGGSGPFELRAGGWIMPAPIFPATVTGTPVIGAATTGGAGPVGEMELVGIYILNAVPTDADLRRILNFERARLLPRKIYLTPFDCPEKRVLFIAKGESTDEGTFYASVNAAVSGNVLTVTSVSGGSKLLPGHVFHNGVLAGVRVLSQLSGAEGGAGTYELSASASSTAAAFIFSGLSIEAQNGFSQTTFVNARNSGSATVYNAFARLSHLPGYQNNVPPSRLLFAPTSGWETGFKRVRNLRPDDGRRCDLLKVAQGSTFRLPGGDNNTTATTNYTNATGGTTTISAGSSRNVGLIPGSALFSSLISRNIHRAEQHGRNAGVGYTTVIEVTNEGLNDAYIGDQAITDDTMYLAMLEAERTHTINDTGISNPRQIFIKPHDPTGVAPGTLGIDPDYPNNAAGASRLTALHRIQDAITNFGTAHPGSVAVLDGNSFSLNGAGNDWIHPDAAGYDAMGDAIDATARTAGFYSAIVEPLA
jgi:hypothetical protein